jgi:hypothetical protein
MICVLCLEYIEIPPKNLSLCSFCSNIGKLIMIYRKPFINEILMNNLRCVNLLEKDDYNITAKVSNEMFNLQLNRLNNH